VSRSRLIERLSIAMDGELTLISAPAGFGKTTLLSEWVQQSPRPAAWLSLDESDNTPIQFWAYLIAALQRLEPGLADDALAALQSRQPPPMVDLLTGLINEIATSPEPFTLILDDFHLITDSRVHEGLTFLIDHLPPQMHLVLSARADPPWPLARRRASGEMTELRAEDLRFTAQEAASFLNDVMKLDLSADDVAALEERTEGWITGLQMAAISMQGRKRSRGVRDVVTFVQAFTASNRFILDYLMEEVLEQQPDTVQDFLLQTSVLERMTAELCDALTGLEHSQEILTRVEQANLFLVPLDDERTWYRYHHLFGGLLQTRLKQLRPQDVPTLHQRASEWYEEMDMTANAVSHALAAGDVARVARLVTGNALAIMGRGELSALARRLDSLPDETRAQPWLAVSHAWVLTYAGQLSTVEARLLEVEEGIASLEESDRAQHLAGHIAAVRAYLAGLRGDMARAAALCREALGHLPEADLMARGFVTSLLGSVLRWAGDLREAAQVSNQAIAMRRAAGDHRVAADAFCDLAALQLVQGDLHAAAATCQDALRSAEEQARVRGGYLSVAGFAHSRLSAVLLERNELDAAVRHAREGVDLAEEWGWADGLVFGYGYLASALQAAGDIEDALDALQQAKQVARTLSPWLEAQVAALEAQQWLARGNLGAVLRWLENSGLSVDDEFPYQDATLYLTLARVLMAEGQRRSEGSWTERGLHLLVRLLEMAETAGATGRVIEVLVAQALALQALDESEQALRVLERALSLAEPRGYVRLFIGEGPPMGELLREAAARGIALDYVRKLLTALGDGVTDKRETTEPPAHRPASDLLEALSEREVQVLRLLQSTLSSSEIAERLFLSPNTVRTHIKNIYRKLDVHKRAEAIQRAHELDLL
jgi:LuxR family maltose regulon positive regulatory protein